jgi:hypothetical protein
MRVRMHKVAHKDVFPAHRDMYRLLNKLDYTTIRLGAYTCPVQFTQLHTHMA